MRPTDLEHRQRELERVARRAGALAMEHFRRLDELTIERKGLQDYVCVADREVEMLVKTELSAVFPEDGFLGEESGATESIDAAWVIDPIDGTGNYVRGLPFFVVSIAFVAEDDIQVGAIFDPIRDVLYSARRGAVPTCNDRAIQVRECTEMSRAMIATGFSRSQSLEDFVKTIQKLVGTGAEFRRMGSAALCLAHVGAGILDGFWQAQLSAWDVLAGLLIVEQAGGSASDFLADGGLTKGSPVLAVTPGIAKSVSEIVGVPLKGA